MINTINTYKQRRAASLVEVAVSHLQTAIFALRGDVGHLSLGVREVRAEIHEAEQTLMHARALLVKIESSEGGSREI